MLPPLGEEGGGGGDKPEEVDVKQDCSGWILKTVILVLCWHNVLVLFYAQLIILIHMTVHFTGDAWLLIKY